MPTKVASYLTELGFKEVENVSDAILENKDSAGEFLVIKHLGRFYRYDGNCTDIADNVTILPTSTGGNTRWVSIGGAATVQRRASGTTSAVTNQLVLTGVTFDQLNEILYVNVSNTQLLSNTYTIGNASGVASSTNPGPYDRIILLNGQTVPANTAYEVIGFSGGAGAENTVDYAILPATLYQHMLDVGTNNTIALNKNFTIYKKTISTASTLNITIPSDYNSSLGVITFELYIDMTTASTILWTPTISWNGGTAPLFNDTKKYLLSFRTFDGGTTWIGNLEMEW